MLTLDDYHAFSSDAVQKTLVRMVEQLPDNLHLVILTRVDPPWPLGRWRTLRWLNEVRAADLSFTEDEIRTLFGEHALTDEAVRSLHRKTEGWVAALQLARLSLANRERPEEFVRGLSGTDRLVADYLIDEVLSRQPPDVLDFFAVSALLDRFCAPLTDCLLEEVSQGQRSRRLLALLERENLFLVPLDNERKWYRYHRLFQSLLTHELKARLSSERRAIVLRRAAEWFAHEGLVEEAIRYYLAAGDVQTAAELVEANLQASIVRDPSRRALGRWLAMFPKTAVRQQPALLLGHACCKVVNWDVSGMAPLLDRATALLEAPTCTVSEERRRGLMAGVDAQRAFYSYWQGDAESALRHALRSLKAIPRERGYHHIQATLYASFSYAATGQREEALQMLADATAEDCASGSRLAGAYLMGQTVVHLYAGNLGAVWDIASKMLSLHQAVPAPDLLRGHAHYSLGSVAYERNLLERAADEFGSAVELRYGMNTPTAHSGITGLALTAWARGDPGKARAYAAAARGFAIEVNDAHSLKLSDTLDLRLATLAHAEAGELPTYSAMVGCTQFWHLVPSLAMAEFLVYRAGPGDLDAALALTDEALQQAARFRNTRQVIQFLAVKAVALRRARKSGAALDVLDRALRMAEPLGCERRYKSAAGGRAKSAAPGL